jgi:hypothetical protein
MTPRTFWGIILKTFGLYICLQLLSVLPQIFNLVIYYRQLGKTSIIETIVILLFTIGIFFLLLIGLFFRTDWIIDKLHLCKNFTEERLEISIHRSTVLKIAIITTGLLLFFENLPPLLEELFTYYQEINLIEGFRRYSNGGRILFHLAELFISFFMITSSRLIVNFIELKRKDKVKI